MSKLMRFLESLPLCERGRRRIRKYKGMSLQVAWKKASEDDLRDLIETIDYPHDLRGGLVNCWCSLGVKKCFPQPPKKVLKLYERANRRRLVQSR